MADNTRKAARGGTYTIFVAIFCGVSFFLTFSVIMGDGQPVCKRSESGLKALTRRLQAHHVGGKKKNG